MWTIFENIGGFFLSPKIHTLSLLLSEPARNWKRRYIQSMGLILITSIFAGFVLMFFMMYPEVYWVPGAFHTGRLFIYGATNPLFIIGMFGLGFILVFFYDFLLHGSISYGILSVIINREKKNRNSSTRLSYKSYLSLCSYSHIFTVLFHIIMVMWMYFFEKFSYTKIFFPVTDLTLPVIIQLIILLIFVILKWNSEYRINLGVFIWFDTSKSTRNRFFIIWISNKIILTFAVLFVVYLSGNLIAGAQWS